MPTCSVCGATIEGAIPLELPTGVYFCDECYTGGDRFDTVWSRLAEFGEVKAGDYERLRGAWESAGKPPGIAQFIRDRLRK